jgi:hypothetical protein
MKTPLFALVLLLFSVSAMAEMVTSSIVGGSIKKLPGIGKVVKKGEVLVLFFEEPMDALIEAQKIKIEMCKQKLITKTYDKIRAEELLKKNSISKDEAEEIIYDYNYAKLDVDYCQVELKKLEIDKSSFTIVAPFDCKVKKVFITENSGTNVGTEILEIEPL